MDAALYGFRICEQPAPIYNALVNDSSDSYLPKMEQFALGHVSIKDVARAAGVSHSTVSRALRASPLVNAATAEQIRQKAEELGYRASAVARSLVTRRSQTLGVIVTSIADPFNGEVVRAIEETAYRNGYSVLLANSQTDPDRIITIIRSFQERRVEGILVTASRVGALYVPLIAETKVPIVLINNRQDSDQVHSVTIDNEAAAREAAKYLIDFGHRRIGFIGDRLGSQSNLERFAGYQRALAEAGIVFRPELLVHGDGRPKAAAEAMTRLLAVPERPSAVLCYNDMSAMGALHTASQSKVRVPLDLSIIGFDDLFFARYLSPPLTTIRQPKRNMGKQATQLLFDLLAGKTVENTVAVKGELIVRSSTAPPKGHP